MNPTAVERLTRWILAVHRFYFHFVARDAFVRTNRRAIAVMFVRLSVCLSVWDGRAL